MRALLRRRSKWFAILAVGILSVLDHLENRTARPDDRETYDGRAATITRVLDGDTIEIDIPDGATPVTRIRLWGVDAPELAYDAASFDAYFGREAADFVEEHYLDEKVVIHLDPNRANRDRYGRLLAYVMKQSTGERLNESLLEEGFAYADPRFEHVMKMNYIAMERRAEKAKSGLWEAVKPEQMPAWRHSRTTKHASTRPQSQSRPAANDHP